MLNEEQVTQNTVEESPLVDSSTTENVQVPDSTQQQVAKEGASEGEFVPKANVDGEVRRRVAEELAPLVQQEVQRILASQQVNRPIPTQPNEEWKYKGYTKSQLEAIISHPEATEQDRLFANRGLGVLEAKEEAVSEFRTMQTKTEAQSRQGMAFQEILKDYPTAFNVQTGQWNLTDPVVNTATQIWNSDKRLKDAGYEGLQVAMDRAFAKMTREGRLATTKKEVQVNAKERQTQKLQSQAMTQGSQAAPSKETGNNAKLQKLMTEYGKTQDPRLFQEIAKLRGLIPSNV